MIWYHNVLIVRQCIKPQRYLSKRTISNTDKNGLVAVSLKILQARTHDFQINIIDQSNKPISSNQFLG